MRLIVEYQQARHRDPISECAAPLEAPVQHLQRIARARARRQRQRRRRNVLHVRRHAGRFNLLLRVRLVRLGQRLPVTDADESARRHFRADFLLLADIPLHEAKHLLAIAVRHEQILVARQVRRVEIPLAAALLAEKRVEQAAIHNQSRRDDEEVPREPRILRRARRVERLPVKQRLQHPRLARARRHLQAILRMAAPQDFLQPPRRQQILGGRLLVEVHQCFRLQHFVRVDRVQDRLLLAVVEVHRPCVHAIPQEPPAQQVGGD